MKKLKINKELWSDFLKIYADSSVENKVNKRVMLVIVFIFLLINVATICFLAIKNQTQDIETMEELLEMFLLLILSSGVVGFGVINNSQQGNLPKDENNNFIKPKSKNNKGGK